MAASSRLTPLRVAVACIVAASVVEASSLAVSVTPGGSYALSAPGGWQLSGAPVRVRINGTWWSAADGSLILVGAPSTWAGDDAWGAFTATTLSWAASTMPATVVFESSFLSYADAPAIIFRGTYPRGASAAVGAPVPSVNDTDGIATEFPAFAMDGGGVNLGFIQWSGTMLNQKNDLGPFAGAWERGTPVSPGLASGPVTLFDAAALASLVLSPASEFMGVSSALSADGDALAWGPLGSATTLPLGFTYDVVAWFGPTVNGNIMAWGAGLLARYGKAHGLSRTDFTNTHLGFNTDNGAYYYYQTGAYANYSAALLAVYDYAQHEGIPYRHILLDSWWYYKDVNKGGTLNWTAQDSAGFFTGGNAGIRALVDATGWKIIAHNRYWSAHTNYAQQNGGEWPFFIDAANDTNHMAVPLSQAFWTWLLSSSVTEWGLTTYEQDWLHDETEGVSALLTNITLGRMWLLQMGAGAASAGVSMQLCMSYPRHALQSVEMPTATQIRASDDHMPGVDSTSQWDMGFSSLLAWALGLAPFKDNYWSTPMQPGAPRPGPETTPSLHNAASTLSAGPVTPGDGVGFSDAAQILRACDASGRLLHPSRALTSIDAGVLARAFPSHSGSFVGVISATYTSLGGALLWDHVLAANLTAPFALRPAHLAPTRADAPLRTKPPRSRGSWTLDASRNVSPPLPPTIAYSLNTTTLDSDGLTLSVFDDAHPFILPPCGLSDFVLIHTAPIFPSGFALLGELQKWVPVSEARFSGVGSDAAGAHASVWGAPGERVNVTWMMPGGGVVMSACTLGDDGGATSTVTAAGGACA